MSNSKLLLAKISNGLLLECLIITIILSTVIFLLDHPIKYVLFIFGVSLTWLLFLTVSRYDYTFKLSLPISDKIVDYFFIVCSAAVLAFNIFANHIMNISFILSIIVSFFLPGWVLLRLLKIDRIQRTNFGLFVLSFSISIGLTSLVYMFALPFKSSTAAIILSIIYVGISVLPLFKDRFYNGGERRQFYSSNHRSEHNLFDILLLIWLILFFIFVISNLYPQMAYLPGIDIIRHFSYTKGLILAPDTYLSQLYPWFHFTWAVVNELSASPPMWLFQSFIAYLSGMLIFSFYIMAKEYLSDIDTRAPILATVFFVVFSGFGWIYFAQHVLNMPNPSQHWYLLHQSALQSHLDIGYGEGSWLWLWFRPITVGFTIFFVLLWLMRREGLTKLNYIIISSLLILTLNQVHFSELIIFVTLLFILALLFPTIKLRLKETAISILISLAATALLIPAYQNLLSSEYLLASNNQYLFVLAALAGLVFILVKYPRRPRISFRMNLTVLTSIALFVYFILLSYWFLHIDNIILDLSEISSVPLEYYPILLGIAGIFAIPCFILLAKKKYRSNPIVIFAILFVLIVIFGRTVTYINANIENTNYWERRLIPFAFVSVSILSSIAILKVIEQLKQHQQLERHFRSLKNILTVTFLSFLVVGGILSTFLSVEYWIINTSKYSLSDKEIDDNHLNSIDPNSTLLTLSERSHNIAEFASVDYLVGYYKYQLWPSESPELPLNILYSLNNPVIIYLSERDLKQITSYMYGNSYIASNLLRMASDTKKSFGNGTTIQTPRLAPTSSSSDTVLVIPEGGAEFYYYAYDILSLGGYNYTSVLVSDINSISKARIVVAPSEQIALKVMDYKSKYNLQYEKLIVLNVDRYDQLVDVDNATFSPLIGEDKPSAGWITSGSGAGKIGVPKIIDNPNTNTSGKNSFRISVGEGEYGLWQISRILSDKPLNLTKFEFVGFNWYGKGDGRWYSLQFTSGPDQFFWYRFQDSWSGWRQVILPMQMSDGRGHISGVTFDKATAKQGASWAKIIRIDLRTEASNVNNGGEFHLDRFGFGNMLQSSSIKWISGKKEIQLPTDIDVYPIRPRSNYDTIAYYNIGVPFILHKKYDSYDMFYLNVQPIIQKTDLENNNNKRHIYPLLGKLLEDIDIKLPTYKSINRSKSSLVTGGVVAFNNATFIGDLGLKSSSAIIDANTDSIRVTIDGNSLILKDVSQVLPINIENVTVKSNGGVINGGSGYYTDVSLNQSSIRFIGHPAILSLNFKEGITNTTIISGKKIDINLANSNMLLREPTVASNGIIDFGNFYGYGELADKMRTLGKDLRIDGKVTFNTAYSDKFTITRGFSFEGNLILSESIYPYDELGSLVNIFSLSNIRYVLTLLLIFVVFHFYIAAKKKSGVPIKTK